MEKDRDSSSSFVTSWLYETGKVLYFSELHMVSDNSFDHTTVVKNNNNNK